MKAIIVAVAGFLAVGLPAYAQTPTNNATTSGTATTPGNSAGRAQCCDAAGPGCDHGWRERVADGRSPGAPDRVVADPRAHGRQHDHRYHRQVGLTEPV